MPELRRLRSSADGSPKAPLCLEFAVGLFAPPVPLGSQAHAYFDGATLFLCSVSLDAPVIVNGAALSTIWAPVFCPAVVWLGEARLDYAVVTDEPIQGLPARAADPWAGHTVLMNVPQTLRSLSLAPRAELPGPTLELSLPNPGFETVTVIGPPPSLEVIVALAEPSVGLAPMRGEASRARSEHAADARDSASRRAISKLCARVKEDFRRTPRNVRVTLFALPIVAWAALTLGGPAESAPLALSISANSSADPQKTSAEKTAIERASDGAASAASAIIEPERVPIAGVTRRKPTLEASAADAAARGAYAESARMYRELAASSPSRPEFAIAARILGSKGAALPP